MEAKRRVDPKDVPFVASQLRSDQQGLAGSVGLVAAPFLSPISRQLLGDEGIAYADSTGNLRLVLDSPAVFIQAEGASTDPWARDSGRPLRSLKGPTAGRVVRALCDFRPPFGVQQLADRSDTSLGSVSRVFAFLESDALIVREPRGPVTDVKWAELIRRWTTDYSFSKTNQVQTFIEPRGLSTLQDKLRSALLRYAISGSLAAADLAPLAPPRLAIVYVDDARAAADDLGVRPTETSANVLLAEPFDSVVYDRTRDVDGLRFATPSQVAADLLTGPGRGPAEGEELLRWMKDNEDAWRQ